MRFVGYFEKVALGYYLSGVVDAGSDCLYALGTYIEVRTRIMSKYLLQDPGIGDFGNTFQSPVSDVRLPSKVAPQINLESPKCFVTDSKLTRSVSKFIKVSRSISK